MSAAWTPCGKCHPLSLPNAGSSMTSNFPLGNFPLPISHLAFSTHPNPISHFPFPTWSLASLVGEQFPVSRFQRATPPLVWKHTFNFPFPISHSLGIGGVGNERSKDKVKDQFPEGDNESGEFPISHCPISNGKLGMCITQALVKAYRCLQLDNGDTI